MSKTQIATNGIADDAVGNTKLDLTANYAFTGTITGVPSGLTKITSHTLSSTSEFNLNGIFSADYENYLMVCSGLGVTGSAGYFSIRLKNSGGNATSNYVASCINWQENAVSGVQRSEGSWRLNLRRASYAATSAEHTPTIQMNIYAPFLAQVTKVNGLSHYRDDNNSQFYTEYMAGHNTNTTSYTDLNFVADNSQNVFTTVTKLTVYGYQK